MLLRNTPHRLPSAAAGYSPLIPPCPTLHFTRLPHRLSTTTGILDIIHKRTNSAANVRVFHIHMPHTTTPTVPPTCTAAASRNAGDTSTSKPATLREEAAASNAEVYDKLIAVFQQRQPSEWRKLIAFSKQFPKLADGVLARCATGTKRMCVLWIDHQTQSTMHNPGLRSVCRHWQKEVKSVWS